MKKVKLSKTRTVTLNRTFEPGISLTSKGTYRCRKSINGIKYENYTTSLASARMWLKNLISNHT